MYFSNGTEGQIFEDKWCNNCKHQEKCPIWLAHMMFNYEQMENPSLKECLNLLIDDGGCFYHEKAE